MSFGFGLGFGGGRAPVRAPLQSLCTEYWHRSGSKALSGAEITAWAGNVASTSLAPPGNRPTWDATEDGGKGAILFTSTDQEYFQSTNARLLFPNGEDKPYTISIRLKCNGNNYPTPFSWGNAVADAHNLIQVYSNAASRRLILQQYDATLSPYVETTGNIGTAWIVVTIVGSGTTQTCYFNGVADAKVNACDVGAIAVTTFRLGCAKINATVCWQGWMSDCWLSSQALTPTQAAELAALQAGKWALK